MSTILTMDKSQIRKQYKSLREGLSKTQIENRSISIANRCLELPIWNKQIMHIFLSIENQKEVDTSFLRTLLQGKEKEIIKKQIKSLNFNETKELIIKTNQIELLTKKYPASSINIVTNFIIDKAS